MHSPALARRISGSISHVGFNYASDRIEIFRAEEHDRRRIVKLAAVGLARVINKRTSRQCFLRCSRGYFVGSHRSDLRANSVEVSLIG